MKINAKNGKYLIVIAFAIAAIVSVILLGKVKINYNISDYLDDKTETKISLGIIEEQFGLSGDVQVMIEDVDLAEADRIKQTILGVENVASVSFDGSSSDSYKDGNALFTVLLSGDEYSESARGAVSDIESALSDEYGDRLHLGGTVSEKIALRNAIQKEIALILAISLCLVAILMLITAKSWLEPLVILAAAGVAVLLNMGTNIFFGQISYITNAVAAILQLALSMDYSIMLLHGYRDMKKTESDKHTAMLQAIKRVLNPVSASALTTMAGLFALLFMSFRIGFDIGIVLIKSILISAISALTLLPAFLLIFDTLLEKTKKRDLVLKGDLFRNLALKYGKFVAPVALFFVVVCCVLQTANSFSFTDASNKNKDITDAFGENNTVIIVYENDELTEEKERELMEVLATFKKSDGSPVLKKTISLSTTVRERYDVKAASDTLGVSEENAELLFALYHLRNDSASVKMSAPEFISFADTLLKEDPDAESLASSEIKKVLGALSSANIFANSPRTAEEFCSVLAESDLVEKGKLNSLKAMIKQMYGLYFYDEIEDNTVVVYDMLSFIPEAAKNPLTKGFITENTVTAVTKFIETIDGLDEQRKELAGYITLKQDLTNQKNDILRQKNELITLRAELKETKTSITAQKQELIAKRQEVVQALEMIDPLLKVATLLGDQVAIKEYTAKKAEAEAGLIQIDNGIAQIDAGIAEIEANLPKIDSGIAQIDEGVIQINDGIAEIDANLPEIEARIAEIDAVIAAVNSAHGYETFVEAIKTFTEPELKKASEKKLELTDKKAELTASLDELKLQLDAAVKSGNSAKKKVLNKQISETTKEIAKVDEELAAAVSEYTALESLGNISKEAIQQLYIIYFDTNGKIPNKKILKNDFVDFVIDTAKNNTVINSFATDETLAMVSLLSDAEKLSYSEMAETLNAIVSATPSLGENGGLGKVSEELLLGTYLKYAAKNDIFMDEKICAEDLVNFLAEGELPLIELSEEQKSMLTEAKITLENGKGLLVGENYSRILLTVDLPAEGADSSKFATDVTDVTKQIFGDGAHVAGEIISSNDLAVAFEDDNKLISVFTIVSIFIIIMLVFKSISLPVLLVAIIQGAIWIAMSTSLITGPMFFMSYIMAICILMGATIDYGILMSTSYVDARSSLDKKDALLCALEIALPTVFTSGLILMICGLVVGLIASQISISSVGFLLFKGTLISTVMITAVLPSVLYLLDGFILKLTLKKGKRSSLK